MYSLHGRAPQQLKTQRQRFFPEQVDGGEGALPQAINVLPVRREWHAHRLRRSLRRLLLVHRTLRLRTR